jgi:hypothetical protein
MFPGSQNFEGRGACNSLKMGTRKNDKHQLFTRTCTNQTTSWLMHNSSTFGANTSHGQIRTHKTHHGWTWGKAPPFSLYYTLCLATRPPSKWFFVPKFLSGSPEIPKVGTPTTLGAHNFVCRPPIEWSLKQSYSPCRKLSNNISHATYKQGNRGNSQLLVARSQIDNLIHGPSFGHNLCFSCPNGSCEPILDIYVPRVFQ